VTRQRKLKEVLNLRLDAPLAQEIRRIATARRQSESEVARELLAYGVNVARQVESQRLSEPFEKEYARREDRPGLVEIKARWREATHEELVEVGYETPWEADDSEERPQ
jgi:hypothetical protein